jgi:predicted neuraminidase
MKQISVFEPQQIGGRWVDPLCIPVGGDIICSSIAAALNLVWFSLNIAAERKDEDEVARLALMCKAMLTVEQSGISIGSDDDLKEALDRVSDVENSQADDYNNSDDDDEDAG